MIAVHLPAVNTFSSQFSIPVDISRLTSGYYLIQLCVKFFFFISENKKKKQKKKQKKKRFFPLSY